MQLLKNSETNCKYLIEEMCNSFFLQAESNISKLEMQDISLNFFKNDHFESILENYMLRLFIFRLLLVFQSYLEIVSTDARMVS